MEVYVLDTETTHFKNPANMEDIVEIGIAKVNLEEKTIEKVYDELVGYNLDHVHWGRKNVWIFDEAKAINRDEINLAKSDTVKPLNQVARDVREIIQHKMVTSYNVGFDFGKFLRYDPWYLNNDHLRSGTVTHRNIQHQVFKKDGLQADFILAPCIMVSAIPVCKISHSYYGQKYPNLDEAMSILDVNIEDYNLDQYSSEVIQDHTKRHRAYYDTIMASMVMLNLYERGKYDISRAQEQLKQLVE